MKKNIRILLIVVGVSVAALYAGNFIKPNHDDNGKDIATLEKGITDVSSDAMLQTVIDNAGGKLLVFDLYAPWCMPCRMLAPTMSKLAVQYGANTGFYRVNIDKLPNVASAFGVSGIPYVVFVKNKQAFTAFTGLQPKEAYEKVITACNQSKSDACIKSVNGAL